ncbi:hypothetical protein [Streptomyces griseus]|uniref:hypothetical protein n=1 Tax=Streptomyces griseus TaxID=1911 RepID=UPI0033B410DB
MQEKTFQAGLADQLARGREELAEACKDTTRLKAAEQSRADVIDRNRTDPRRKEALADLTPARNAWQDRGDHDDGVSSGTDLSKELLDKLPVSRGSRAGPRGDDAPRGTTRRRAACSRGHAC